MNISDQVERARRESMRWLCLLCLEQARPKTLSLEALQAIIMQDYPDVSKNELERHLDYLRLHHLLSIEAGIGSHFSLTGIGVDVVEFNADSPAGVARPCPSTNTTD